MPDKIRLIKLLREIPLKTPTKVPGTIGVILSEKERPYIGLKDAKDFVEAVIAECERDKPALLPDNSVQVVVSDIHTHINRVVQNLSDIQNLKVGQLKFGDVMRLQRRIQSVVKACEKLTQEATQIGNSAKWD